MRKSNDEKNSFQDSRKTSEYRNKAKKTSEEANEILEKLKSILSSAELINEDLLKNKEEIENNKSEAKTANENFDEKVGELSELIKNLEEILKNHPDLKGEIESFKTKIESLDELNTKINSLFSNSSKRKQEIDELYFEINGYTLENKEAGEEENVPGLKDKLEKIYSDLEAASKNIKKEIEDYKKQKEEELENLKISSEKDYKNIQTSWEEKFNTLENKIEGLLPNALTAGLSSAYSNKKDDEIEELDKRTVNFYWGIGLLIGVSLIPFLISIIFLFQDMALEDVILKLPRLVLSILPLYVPVGWFAYYANKRVNLSKRLIEEYAHKEVLSKTFEGLSTQIKDLDDSEISKELRLKLLTNILEVSSENPGKLISDYNSSDHPIIDVLNKSEKLSKSIDKLEKIPGIGKIADFLKNTSKKVIEKKEESIAKAIDEVTK